ncbi:MAG: NAD(P)H-hydrate dehydratase, partial [Candidatus Hydrothermarchaeaceae archaeon]
EVIKIPGVKKNKIDVYCGKGNNGGDGLVCARHLHRAGYKVEVFITEAPSTPEASENLKVLKEGLPVSNVKNSNYISDIIVDALLGTGIRGEVREPIRSIIKKINASKAYRVSVDVPSGLDEKGKGYCVRTDKVITFHRSKRGLERFNTIVKDIGIPMRAETHVGPGDLIANITRRADSHKGDNGRVLIIGGSVGYHGAPILSALGALNSGADLIHLAVPECNWNVTKSYAPDFIIKKFPGEYLGSEGPWHPEGEYDSIVIGPGLGIHEETREAIIEMLKKTQTPVVVDADAIKAIAGAKLKVNGVITPHSKEFQILSGRGLPKDNEKRKDILLKKSREIGSVILFKAPLDIIVGPDGRWKFNATGNAGMTVGGTGDVLAGVTGGLIAQGMKPFTAACCATFINGSAGDELHSWKGNCFTASDLAYEIPFTIKRMLDFEGV